MRTPSQQIDILPKARTSILRISTYRFHTRPSRPALGFTSRSLRPPPIFQSSSVTPAPSHPVGEFLPGRCCVRGCIYPAGPTGMCLDHHHQANEPRFFHSYQPTLLVLEQARFGVPDSNLDDTRSHDRRRLVAAREASWEDAA